MNRRVFLSGMACVPLLPTTVATTPEKTVPTCDLLVWPQVVDGLWREQWQKMSNEPYPFSLSIKLGGWLDARYPKEKRLPTSLLIVYLYQRGVMEITEKRRYELHQEFVSRKAQEQAA